MVAGSVVAVVDDNIAVLHSMKLLLELEGYEVLTHNSPASFFADRTTRSAGLIVDQNMPGMTGLQLVAQLRQQEDYIPILLMCGLLSPEIITRATELKMWKLIEKPVEPDDLVKFVADLLQEAGGYNSAF